MRGVFELTAELRGEREACNTLYKHVFGEEKEGRKIHPISSPTLCILSSRHLDLPLFPGAQGLEVLFWDICGPWPVCSPVPYGYEHGGDALHTSLVQVPWANRLLSLPFPVKEGCDGDWL